MGFFKRSKTNKVCVIGLDGVPCTLLQRFADQGVMPHFKNLIDSGTLHSLKASLPEISSVSWTDFMTGTNPGNHGIFGFTDLKENSYDLRFPNFNDVKARTLWDKLGEMKRKSIVINQPSTYPARRINGVLISGFVAIELEKAVYPLSYKTALEHIGYEIDIDTYKAREDHEFLWKELDRTLAGRRKAFNFFWDEEWDYFEFVFTGTDRLQHFLWDALEDTEHPYHQRYLDYYNRIDGLVGSISEAFQKKTGSLEGLFLLSDHGFTGIKQEVYLNTWLKENGYLNFESANPKNLGDMTGTSTAFTMDPNRIYLHYTDRYPRGSVDRTNSASLKTEIGKKLLDLEYNGQKVVRKVYDTKDIYSGPMAEKGPDLIVQSEHGFDMKGSVKKEKIFGRTSLQGMHTWDNAFFWSTLDHGPDLEISNLSDIIMDNF
ncbi:alkaline phosphatase family protein [Acidobacteriota bacterium]